MRDRRLALAVAVVGLLAAGLRHPTADIRLLTHDAGDRSPARIQAAIDLGLMGVSFLYTWTRKLG